MKRAVTELLTQVSAMIGSDLSAAEKDTDRHGVAYTWDVYRDGEWVGMLVSGGDGELPDAEQIIEAMN